MGLPKSRLNLFGLAAFPDDLGVNPFDQSLNTTDNVFFNDVIVSGSLSIQSLFDGTGGYAALAFMAQMSADTTADDFFGAFWGTPTFDASNLFGFASGLTATAAVNASYADGAGFASTAGVTEQVSGTVGFSVFIIDGTSYYPHVSAGVLTFTDAP